MEVKNSIKPVDYIESMKILEKRVQDVFQGKKDELLWIWNIILFTQLAPVQKTVI